MDRDNHFLEGGTLPSLSAEDYIGIVRRRCRVIGAFIALGLLVAVVIALTTKPVYTASAKLLIDSGTSTTNTVDTADPIASLMAPSTPQTVETQVAMLQATPLLNQVSKQTNISLGELATHLSVTNVEATNVIEVTADLHNAKAAASSVNLLLTDYLKQQKADDQSSVGAAYAYMTQRKKAALMDLRHAQAALKSYQGLHGISEVDRNRDNLLANAASLTNSYQADLSSMAGVQSRANAEKSLLAQQPSVIMFTVRSTNSAIQEKKEEINRLIEQKVSLTQPGGYTEHAPAVQAINAQIAQLRRELATEPPLSSAVSGNPNSVREDLNNRLTQDESDLANLKAHVAVVKQQLAATQTQSYNYPGYAIALANLNDDVQTAQADYDLYSTKAAHLSIRQQTYNPHATILETADVPTLPTQPKKGQIVGFGIGVGAFLGLLAALLLEFWDDRIYEYNEIIRDLRLPVLGQIPVLTGSAGVELGSTEQVDRFRFLRANLLLNNLARATNSDKSIRTLAITSAESGAGVTTVAMNLACALAEANVKTVLIDTNLRRPALHKALETPLVPGLMEILNGNAKLSEVLLEKEGLPELMTITCGAIPSDPTGVLQSKRFSELHSQLLQLADVVILDTPAVSEGADAQILSSLSDGVLMVVSMKKTRKKSLLKAIASLSSARGHLLGLCTNTVTSVQASPVVITMPKSERRIESGMAPNSKNVFAIKSGPRSLEDLTPSD